MESLFPGAFRESSLSRAIFFSSCFSVGGVFLADLAAAGCSQRPNPGIDWSKYEKERLILRSRDLSAAILEQTDLSNSDLASANLKNAQMSEAILGRTRLRGADSENADLTKVQGDGANFASAKLTRAVFTKSEFPRADFTEADLRDANLSGGDLTESYLKLTRIEAVDLSGVNGLTSQQLASACGDSETRLREGIKELKSWLYLEAK